MPEITVPLATYTGWNLFRSESGPEDVLSSMQGSYIPFPRTTVDRQRTNDPRRAIEERYRSREQYVGLVSDAALAPHRRRLPARRRPGADSGSGQRALGLPDGGGDPVGLKGWCASQRRGDVGTQ